MSVILSINSTKSRELLGAELIYVTFPLTNVRQHNITLAENNRVFFYILIY